MMFYYGLNLFFGGNMKRKLIAFLIVCTIMLTGCGSGGGLVQIQRSLTTTQKLLRVISGNSLLLMANYSSTHLPMMEMLITLKLQA